MRWLSAVVVCQCLAATLSAQAPARAPVRPDPATLASASPALIDRLRGDAFAYFRFVNRPWTERVCEAFADVPNPPIVRLHGDAHVEQFAVTADAWGLDDCDDSTRGPTFVDIVRYLGSIDLATRQRGWQRDRDALWDRFFEGYRRGLVEPAYRAPEPDLVRELRFKAPRTRTAYLAWADSLMQPMEQATLESVVTAMKALDDLVRRERPNLAREYFTVVHAGWLRIGIGSSVTHKVLIRVQGPTVAPTDDVILEGKEVTNLSGVRCLESDVPPSAARVIDGTLQLGRLKHDILAVGPTQLMPVIADHASHSLEWWVSSWEPSYREVHLTDLRSSKDLGDIAFDSGVQLGAGKRMAVRDEALWSVRTLEARLRRETSALVEELLAGWRELGGR